MAWLGPGGRWPVALSGAAGGVPPALYHPPWAPGLRDPDPARWVKPPARLGHRRVDRPGVACGEGRQSLWRPSFARPAAPADRAPSRRRGRAGAVEAGAAARFGPPLKT